MKNTNQNTVLLVGKLTDLKKIWSSIEQTIYEGVVEIIRDSGNTDYIPILFSNFNIAIGDFISVKGQFRSRDVDNNGKLKVELYVYAKEINIVNSKNYKNDICITGYICKKPTLRTTPSGKQISDLLIACNYSKDKTAYIPVVAWGREARKCGKYNVGTEILINGRLQSRKYMKEINNKIEEKIAYELSAFSIEDICKVDTLDFISM